MAPPVASSDNPPFFRPVLAHLCVRVSFCPRFSAYLTFFWFIPRGLFHLAPSAFTIVFSAIIMVTNLPLAFLTMPSVRSITNKLRISLISSFYWFESRTGLNFFRLYFHNCLSCVHNWDDFLCISIFIPQF